MDHKVPDWIEHRIRSDGGVNEQGKPNFRIMWGGHRTTIMGGKWGDNGRIEYREMLKYPEAENRWIVEQYCYPEMTREEWAANFTKNIDGQMIETMGPYPEQGEYELLKVIETPKRHYVPLTATIVDAIIHVARINKHIPVKDKIDFARKRREREQKERDAKKDEILGRVARPSWALNPHVVLSQMKEGLQHG